jgi:hypothetical protein
MVKIAAVVDSACLIGLERIGRLDLLPALLDPVFAPPAVNQEFGAAPKWLTVERPAASVWNGQGEVAKAGFDRETSERVG